MFVMLHLDGHILCGMNIAEFVMFAEKGTYVSYGHISSYNVVEYMYISPRLSENIAE